MNKLSLVLLATALACTVALAQGKISFQTDSLHLVYYGPGLPGDAVAGQGVYSADMPSGVTLVADLYVGTSSSLLSFVSSAAFSLVPGKWEATSVQVPGILGGTQVFVATQIRDQTIAPQSTFQGNFGTYYTGVWGFSQEFTFTLGSSVTYPVMWGANGTWPVGTYALDQYGVGARGAIPLLLIPEPATIELAAMGAVLATTFARCRWIRRI